MVSPAELEASIRSKVDKITTLVVSDVSGGCGQAYDVVIVSEVFEGLPTLKRHRMVNELLKDQIAQLHAFSQKTYTPKQYEGLNPTNRPPTIDTTGAAAPSTSPSVPELTLTTDPDTTSGAAGQNAGHPLTPGAQPGGTTSQLPGTPVPPPLSPSISNLHHAKVSSVEFWSGLSAFLDTQFQAVQSEGSPGERAAGEAEMERLFEDFFLSQKPHLSSSDVARIRDATGMWGMAGV